MENNFTRKILTVPTSRPDFSDHVPQHQCRLHNISAGLPTHQNPRVENQMKRILLLLLLAASLFSVYASDTTTQTASEPPAVHLANPPGTELLRDISYGPARLQRFDVYKPAKATSAPIIMMVHGGAWMRGDKSASNVVKNKVAHWIPKGWITISVNNRLSPEANPIEQTEDVARALACVQARATSWGGDPNRIILMGHSAGAHLVALLTASPAIAKKETSNPWLATISLDSAAYNIERIMELPHFGFYDTVFKSDPTFWREASPTLVLKSKAVPMLLVCSTQRVQSCPQAHAFASKAISLGGQAVQLAEDLTHEQINELLGTPCQYTNKVDEFISSVSQNLHTAAGGAQRASPGNS
jgi:acetyl esterase/lipase